MNQILSKCMPGKFAFYAKYYFFETVCMHPAHGACLCGIPNQLFIIQVYVSQLIQIGVFTTHIKYGNELLPGISRRKLIGNFYNMKNFINKIQIAREYRGLMGGGDS